jgi:hypothetical protein
MIPVAALVLASLVFSVGGVAFVGRADSETKTDGKTPSASNATPGPLFDAKPIEKGCEQPQRRDVRIPANRFAVAGDTIQLNTRGYNYAGPGEIQMDPTGRTPPGELPDMILPPAPPAPRPR